MLFWIFAALILHAVYVFTPTFLFFPTEGLGRHMAGRDDLPEPSKVTARARRALANWQESLPVFIALAVLAVALDADATLGAAIFVLARVAYLPLYMIAIPGLRTVAWTVAIVGLLMMAFALV